MGKIQSSSWKLHCNVLKVFPMRIDKKMWKKKVIQEESSIFQNCANVLVYVLDECWMNGFFSLSFVHCSICDALISGHNLLLIWSVVSGTPIKCLAIGLCCFQTSLLLAALPLWWWFLYNCASATRRSPQTKDQAVSSLKPINRLPRRFAHSSRPQTVAFYSTSEQYRTVKRPKQPHRWELQLQHALDVQMAPSRPAVIRRWNGTSG